ncbi:hypothetical protein GCM10025768_28220 [Microbacterium pseudoresistens]
MIIPTGTITVIANESNDRPKGITISPRLIQVPKWIVTGSSYI